MLGSRKSGEERTRLKFSIAAGSRGEIGFEPIGTSFALADGDYVILELPVRCVEYVECVAWPNGIAVWVPFPDNYVVYDSSGNEVDRL